MPAKVIEIAAGSLEQIGQSRGELRDQFARRGAAQPLNLARKVRLVGIAGLGGQIGQSGIRGGGGKMKEPLKAKDAI
jgi:hypothetical protein